MGEPIRVLELDLTCVDVVDGPLLQLLAEMMRASRVGRFVIKIVPSLALERWLTICCLDEHLRPRHGTVSSA